MPFCTVAFCTWRLNGVMLAVMGQVLERKLGKLSFFSVFAAGAIGGALVHALIGGSPEVPLVGASAGVGALYGAGLVLHGRGVSLGPNTQTPAGAHRLFRGHQPPRHDPAGALSNIAYVAHLGGFVTGILVTAWLARPTPGLRS